MNIRYRIAQHFAKNFSTGNSFILTNRQGSFYQHNKGWFVKESGEEFQVLNEIKIAAPKVSAIEHRLYMVEQLRNNVREQFFLPFGEQALVYRLNRKHYIDLICDVRKVHNSERYGRLYDLLVEDGKTIIRFRKITDKRESQPQKDDFIFFIVVNNPGKTINRWKKQSKRFIHQTARFCTNELVITASQDRNKAIKINDKISSNLNKIIASQREYAETFTKYTFNLAVASYSLDSLTNTISSNPNIQSLPRSNSTHDTIVALEALGLIGEQKLIKQLLLNFLDSINEELLTKNFHPHDNIQTLNGIGWLFKRFDNLTLTIREKAKVEEKLVNILDKIKYNQQFLINQTLQLSIYNFAHSLTKNSIYHEKEQRLLEDSRRKFWNGRQLTDLNNPIPDANIFVAAYLYPTFLTNEEWVTCFENVLPKLSTNWGGLTKNNKSYFWINNIAAIVLNRTNKTKFKETIKKIYKASKNEMLWSGALGTCSEYSSTKELTSEGIPANVASTATFVELEHELNKH
jgi:hypothetical protein